MWSSMPRAVLMLLVLAAVACDDENAEGEGEGETEGETMGSEDCVQDTTVIDVADDSGLGFTAQDLLANIVGNYPDTLVWSAADGPAYYHMAGTSVGLSIDVSFDGGEVRYVQATPSGWCDGACADSCESRLEIDGVLALASDDGVLDENLAAVFTATTVTEASYYVTFDPDQTQGTLSSESFVIADGNSVDTLIAEGAIRDGAISGSIGVQFALSSDGGGFGVFPVGDW